MVSFLTKVGIALAKLAFIELLSLAFFVLAFNQTVLDANSYGPALQAQGLDTQLHDTIVSQFTSVLGSQVDSLTSDESLQTMNEGIVAQGGTPLDSFRVKTLANVFKAHFNQELGTRFTPGDVRLAITDILRRVLGYLKGDSNTIDLKPPVHAMSQKLFTSASDALNASYPEFSTGLRAELNSSGVASNTVDGLDAQVNALEVNLAAGNLTGSGVNGENPLASLEAGVDAYTATATAPDCSPDQLALPESQRQCKPNPINTARDYISFLTKLPWYLFAASLACLALLMVLVEGTKERLKAVWIPLLMVGLMLLTTGFLTDQAIASGLPGVANALGPGGAQAVQSLQNPNAITDTLQQAIVKTLLALLSQMNTRMFNWGVVVTLVALALFGLTFVIKTDEKPVVPNSGGLEAYTRKN